MRRVLEGGHGHVAVSFLLLCRDTIGAQMCAVKSFCDYPYGQYTQSKNIIKMAAF